MLKKMSSKKNQILNRSRHAQTAMEYMLLLAVVVSIVLIFIKLNLPEIEGGGNFYFEKVVEGIYGGGYACGDGNCRPGSEIGGLCCVDCGGCNCKPGVDDGCPLSTGTVAGYGCSSCPNGTFNITDASGQTIARHCTKPPDTPDKRYTSNDGLCEDLTVLQDQSRGWSFDWEAINW